MNVIELPHEKDSAPSKALATQPAVAPASVEVRAVRGSLPSRPLPMDKTERRTIFSLGAVAGMGVALCFFAAFSPRPQPTDPQLAAAPQAAEEAAPSASPIAQQPVSLRPSAAMGYPVVVLPDVTVIASQIDVSPASVPRVAPKPRAVATAAPVPASKPKAAPVPELASAPAAAPVGAFGGATVVYEAPGAAEPAADREGAIEVVAEATQAPASLKVISVPSPTLALIGSDVGGKMMVSPYKVGQTLPDGRVIVSLDPSAGTVQTSRGVIAASSM